MTVITISRQFGSHGDTVAQLLCDRLGYRYFDKNLMLGLAAAAGLPTETIVDLSDEKHHARSLVERLFGNYPAPMADPNAWAAGAEASAQEKAQVEQVKQLIRATYAQGNVVFVGRGGQVVLRGLPDVLHVRLIAPLELRIRRHGERAGLTAAEAREAVLARDRASADLIRQYYDADVADPALYDLMINTSKVTPSAAADLIIRALAYLPGSPEPAAGK